MKYSDIIKEGLEPQEYWNDWDDYRDGFRDLTHFGSCGENCEYCKDKIKSIKKKALIRKAKRYKRLEKGE